MIELPSRLWAWENRHGTRPLPPGMLAIFRDDGRELLAEIERQCSLMVAVATGGPRIQQVNLEYTERYERIAGELARRGSPQSKSPQRPVGLVRPLVGRGFGQLAIPPRSSFRDVSAFRDRVKAGPSGTGVRASRNLPAGLASTAVFTRSGAEWNRPKQRSSSRR